MKPIHDSQGYSNNKGGKHETVINADMVEIMYAAEDSIEEYVSVHRRVLCLMAHTGVRPHTMKEAIGD